MASWVVVAWGQTLWVDVHIMITVIDYTDYESVRAILGVSEYEITDSQLALPMYASALQRVLRGVVDNTGKSLATFFDEITADASPSTAEDTLLGLIKELSAYVVAEACLPGLSLAAYKSESDGKANVTRFSAEATFLSVSNNIRSQISRLKSEIFVALGNTTLGMPITPLTRIEPDVDVVTE